MIVIIAIMVGDSPERARINSFEHALLLILTREVNYSDFSYLIHPTCSTLTVPHMIRVQCLCVCKST